MSGISSDPSADAPTQNQRTVWPLDRLTSDTEDAVIGGELVKTDPDAGTIELRSVGAKDEALTVDVSNCAIREYLFEHEPKHVHLKGVETVVFGVFLRAYGTEQTTASILNAGLGHERTIVPQTNNDSREYEVLIA